MPNSIRDFLRPLQQAVAGAAGIDLQKTALSILGLPPFLLSAYRYWHCARGTRFELRLRHLHPVTADRLLPAGTASGHYFHQDLWAARRIYVRRPERHVDVGSRVDGFVSHLLVFMDVDLVDVRTLHSNVRGLRFVRANAEDLAAVESNSIDSLSSLHALEHFGLGRYGDPISPSSCFRAMSALKRVLRPRGRLYVGVPIGRERVEFNAHRVFAPDTVLQAFAGLELVSFAAVHDDGDLREPARPEDYSDARYACGLFEFTKSDTA